METEFIHWLRAHVPPHPRFPLGLSDDAALLTFAGQGNLIITTDLSTEGVDYHLSKDDPRRIGRKALAANLSDIAAMAARPLAAFISLALPREPTPSLWPVSRPSPALTSLELAIKLYEGMLPLAAEFDLALPGGDTNTYDGSLVISITLLGEVTEHGPLKRSGGKPGDWLLVTGELGGTILGHSFDFTPRVHEALTLHDRYKLHAGMDLSDGLAMDASRLAAASNCGAVLHLDQVPISDAAFKLSDQENATQENRQAAALRHAISDGEDFELLLALPPEVAKQLLHDQPLPCKITQVGELVSDLGLYQQSPNGTRAPLKPIGWLH